MTNGESLRVSVVVATRDRAALLERLLASLASQTVSRGEVEVIVVDDGSTDSTPEVVERFARAPGARVRGLRMPRPSGPAAARNRGWRIAEAPVVAFTDDDCVPQAHWLAAGLEAIATGAGVVMGRTVPRKDDDNYGRPFSRTMEVVHEDGRYPTCNVFYRRDALARAGGFDESFRFACGEDTDLAWRVKELGFASSFAANAVVIHEVRAPSFFTFLKERRRFADQVLVVKRHPALRRLYYRRFFYQRSHVHAVAALVALVAAAASGTWLPAALLPIVWLDRFRHTRLTGTAGRRVTTAVELLIGDLWELLVFAYVSARHRALLI